MKLKEEVVSDKYSEIYSETLKSIFRKTLKLLQQNS